MEIFNSRARVGVLDVHLENPGAVRCASPSLCEERAWAVVALDTINEMTFFIVVHVHLRDRRALPEVVKPRCHWNYFVRIAKRPLSLLAPIRKREVGVVA